MPANLHPDPAVRPGCPKTPRLGHIFFLTAHPGEGRFTDPTAAAQTWRPELVFMPPMYVWTGCLSQVRWCCWKSLIRPVDRLAGRGLDGSTHAPLISLTDSLPSSHYLWRQWRNGPNRFKELRRRGVPKFHAAVAAGSPTGYWRMSGHRAVQQALRNPYFDALGLPRLYVPAQA